MEAPTRTKHLQTFKVELRAGVYGIYLLMSRVNLMLSYHISFHDRFDINQLLIGSENLGF